MIEVEDEEPPPSPSSISFLTSSSGLGASASAIMKVFSVSTLFAPKAVLSLVEMTSYYCNRLLCNLIKSIYPVMKANPLEEHPRQCRFMTRNLKTVSVCSQSECVSSKPLRFCCPVLTYTQVLLQSSTFMDNGMKQQLCDMNGTTANQYEEAAAAAVNFPHVDSPPATFASTLMSWAFQSTLPPVVVPNQHDRAPSCPSPTSVASTSSSMAMTMMQQPAIGWATYSEPHPHYAPYNEAPEPYSYTPKAHQFQPPPSPPDADSDDPDCDIPLLEYSVKSRRGKELFVAHIPFDMTEEELLALCSQYGDVMSASIMHHDLGVSKCFAYVKFKLQSAADNALLRLNHYEVDGKFLFVDYAMRQAQERSLSDDGENQANRQLVCRATSAPF
eukprot:scaffold1610_cov79-Skeletonema_dohrnii-CCMP3373.AAC.2